MKTKITLKESRKALQTIFDYWSEESPNAIGTVVDTIDYTAREKDSWDSKKSGEFQTLGTSFEGKKVIVRELPEMVGKTLAEVGEYIKSKGWTPVGHEYMQWLYENSNKSPEGMALGTYDWYYGFGSLFRFGDGFWDVPCVLGGTSGFRRYGDRLDGDWLSNYRVVLLDFGLELDPLKSDLSLESLALRIEKIEKFLVI